VAFRKSSDEQAATLVKHPNARFQRKPGQECRRQQCRMQVRGVQKIEDRKQQD
jgi:hypothetical protein